MSELAEIQAQDKRYRIAFNLSPDSININRLSDGKYLDVNESFSRITGYSRDEVIGKSSLDLGIWANPEDRNRLVSELNRSGKVTNLEAKFRIKDGSIRIGLMSAQVIQLDGESCILSVTRDIQALKDSQRSQRRQNLLYRQLVESAFAIPWRLDLSTWRFNFVGPQAERLLGYAIEDWYSEKFWEYHIHPDDRDWALKYCRDCVARNQDHEFEYRMIGIDGRVVWVRDNVSVISDKNGAKFLQGFLFDITKLKQLQESLSKQTEQLEILASASHNLNSVLDTKTIIRSLVRSGIKLVQAEAGTAGLIEQGEMVFREYITEKKITPAIYSFETGVGIPGHVMKTGNSYIANDVQTDPYVTPEIRDKFNFFNCINVAIKNKEQVVIGCLEIHNRKNRQDFDEQDATILQTLASHVSVSLNNAELLLELENSIREQKKYTQRLKILNEIDHAILKERSTKDMAKAVLNHLDKFITCRQSSVLIIEHGVRQAHILALNGAHYEELASGSLITLKENFIGIDENSKHFQDINNIFNQGSIEKALKVDKTDKVLNSPLIAHNKLIGNLVICLDKSQTLNSEQQEVIHETAESIAIAIHHAQLDEEVHLYTKKLESRVAERTEELRFINKELESFSYTVSHDLKAPLRSIAGFAKIINEDFGNQIHQDVKNHLDRIINATQRMNQLIHDLLGLSQVNQSKLNRSTINLSTIIQEICQDLSAKEPTRKTNIVIDPNMYANADPKLIRIALENLINNAWKFCSKKATTDIEFRRVLIENAPVFSVKDNGAGFDPKMQNKLFNAFERLHDQADYEGTGVGLSTVKRIINRHGGNIWAESSVNIGAIFYFTLPQ